MGLVKSRLDCECGTCGAWLLSQLSFPSKWLTKSEQIFKVLLAKACHLTKNRLKCLPSMLQSVYAVYSKEQKSDKPCTPFQPTFNLVNMDETLDNILQWLCTMFTMSAKVKKCSCKCRNAIVICIFFKLHVLSFLSPNMLQNKSYSNIILVSLSPVTRQNRRYIIPRWCFILSDYNPELKMLHLLVCMLHSKAQLFFSAWRQRQDPSHTFLVQHLWI